MKNYKVIFPEYGKEIFALQGSSLFECIYRAGILIKSPCAGQGICGKCRVIISSGNCPPSAECEKFFSQQEIEQGYRLACRVKILSDLTVKIPHESSFEHELLVLTQDDKPCPLEVNPFVRKIYFQAAAPDLENQTADFQILREKLSVNDSSIELLRQIPHWLRKNAFQGTAIVSGKKLLALEEGDKTKENYGIAIDLGTTSIVASMINVTDGSVIDSKGTLNPQVKFGDDLLSRILAQRNDPENLSSLRKSALEACNSLIRDLCLKNKIQPEKIYSATIAGNSVMECFICGVTAEFLGEIPFCPPFKKSLTFSAKDLGLEINHSANVYIFPLIGGFIGGDIVSGAAACRLDEKQKPTIFIDIGTNSEIVLSVDGKLYAASAAAGPAFEGARIEAGMRAIPGAIEKIVFSEDGVHINTIKNSDPSGICGSAIIDVVAEMLKWGLIEQSGRIISPDEADSNVPDELKKRLTPSADGTSWDFLLCENRKGKKIFIRQKDIREVQLASGAIRTAILILMKKADLTAADLDAILIAGAFGSFIRRSNAKRIGMIPDIPDHMIRYVGNTSIEGAREALVSFERMKKAEEISEKTSHIEISLDPDFQTLFAESMIFP